MNEEPPPPPPVEGTIVDAPVHFGAGDPLDETTAREMRSKRRKDKDPYPEDGERRRRRREGGSRRDDGVRSSEGSGGDGRSRGGPVNGLGYDDVGVKTWDGRPAMPGKRGSWFKKIAGL